MNKLPTEAEMVASIKARLDHLDNQESKVIAAIKSEKTKLAASLKIHLAAHEKAAAAHSAEVQAVQALIHRAVNTAVPAAPEFEHVAALVLTAPQGFQKTVSYVHNHWRKLVFCGCVMVLLYSKLTGVI